MDFDEQLIKFVDEVLQNALNEHASDIHIEPYETNCRIRYRKDGLLYLTHEISTYFASRIIARLKIMAKLDITEKRLPQDGRLQIISKSYHPVDIRMNTCPTLHGEKLVLRILDINHIALDINSLGFTEKQKIIFLGAITKPHGMILLTGPTGSGKTITLYSALRYLNTIEKNISTIEDPIEISLEGINQMNINPKLGLDFSSALQTLLRQDPDIIMVGEIRDQKTATLALQAAQTGHLVLSTLHTNNAAEALTRLQTLGISSQHINKANIFLIAQRLVRTLCTFCKLKEFQYYKAVGCEHCLQGYQGRTGIYEFICQRENDTTYSLRTSVLNKVEQGITSLYEANRVIPE